MEYRVESGKYACRTSPFTPTDEQQSFVCIALLTASISKNHIVIRFSSVRLITPSLFDNVVI